MGSNLFTNEDQNTLLNKIEGVFQYKKPKSNKEITPEIIISESFDS